MLNSMLSLKEETHTLVNLLLLKKLNNPVIKKNIYTF